MRVVRRCSAKLAAGTMGTNTISDPTSDPVRENVALELLMSTEARQDLVANAYVKFMGRPVDAAGSSFWVNSLNGGTTDQQFYAQLLGSAEYYTKHSS